MKNDPLVTVLMPCFNGGPFLRDTLKSILNQTFYDYELLIINDCSTDDSLKTIQSFNDQRIRIHTNTVNLGQTKSLNIGLKLSRGKYVAINDADDLSLPERIEKQVAFIRNRPEYPVIGTSCFIMDKQGMITRTFHRPTDPRAIQLQFLSDTPMTHGSVLMDKNFILSVGGYDEEFRIIQDYELWSALMRKGYRVGNLPETLVVIRTFSDSISFRERDAQTTENGKTIQSNVEAMTGLNVSLEEATRQRLFFVSPERLTGTEFDRAERLFRKEYESLLPKFRPEKDFIRSDLANRVLKPYAKLSIARLQKGKLRETRQVISNYMVRYRPNKLLLFIWGLSFLGPSSIGSAMRIYETYQKLKARRSCSIVR